MKVLCLGPKGFDEDPIFIEREEVKENKMNIKEAFLSIMANVMEYPESHKFVFSDMTRETAKQIKQLYIDTLTEEYKDLMEVK